MQWYKLASSAVRKWKTCDSFMLSVKTLVGGHIFMLLRILTNTFHCLCNRRKHMSHCWEENGCLHRCEPCLQISYRLSGPDTLHKGADRFCIHSCNRALRNNPVPYGSRSKGHGFARPIHQAHTLTQARFKWKSTFVSQVSESQFVLEFSIHMQPQGNDWSLLLTMNFLCQSMA